MRAMGNLPAELTSFVDRTQEQATVDELLEQARLVTLTGVGGVGKTRLALQVAGQVRQMFSDGVWLVELSALQDPDLLAHTVAAALGVQDQSARPQQRVLAEFVADRRMLVILDTCEHLLTACAELAELLLRAAPDLRLLTTSRRALDLAGEHILVVDPLPIEDADTPGRAAVALLTQRAQAVLPDFRPTPAAAQLCRQLDGIPLAIELAAVRLRVLSVEQVLDRIDNRFALLEGGIHAALPRHQALRTAIGWSHELCAPQERLLWARLSVFPGTFGIDAVQAVCADAALPAEHVVEVLRELVEASIVQRLPGGGPSRYRQLDTVRAYGATWLHELGQQAELQVTHLDYCLNLARWFDAEWCGSGQVACFERMGQELNNIRAALDFCLSSPAHHEKGLDLAGTLALFWIACGGAAEGRHHYERFLALCPRPSPVRTRALWAYAWTAMSQGDLDAAQNPLAECQAATTTGDSDYLWSAMLSGALAMFRGDPDTALNILQAPVALARRTSAPGAAGAAEIMTLLGHGLVRVLLGESDLAAAALQEVRDLCDQRGELWARSYADTFHSQAFLAQQNYPAAIEAAQAAMKNKWELGDTAGSAMSIDVLAAAAAATGDAPRTARLLGITHRLWRLIGGVGFSIPALLQAREQSEQTARSLLGDHAYEAAFRTGTELPDDQIAACALKG